VGIIEDLSKAGKVALQVGNTAMVNVAIRAFALPELWIEPEVLRHVFVDKLLKIYPKSTIASHDKIG